MRLAAGQRLGPYEIVSLLGAGGMGEVYRARDARLGRDVALKVVTPDAHADADASRRFLQEARAAAALNHPNVLAVHDVGSEGDVTFVVSELLEGRSLRALLASGPVAVRKVIDYAVQLANGLAAAHAAGVIHRDLKPENVFVTRDERVKILDFGLAKLAPSPFLGPDDATGEVGGTTPGTILGTIGYMAPEQVRGATLDYRSDIFAFGAVLYEMLCGRRAFPGASAADVMSAILREDPPDITPGQGPSGVERIARRCLEKRPEARFQTAADLAFALASIPPSGVAPEAVTRAPRRAIVAIVALASMLVLLTSGLTWRAGVPRSPAGTSYQRLTFRSGVVTNARFAADGETVVYSAEWGHDSSRLFATRLGSPESRPLGPEGRLQSISASGDISFTHGFRRGSMPGLLARVPLAGGAARDVAEGVIAADWTADGAGHAIVRQVGNERLLEWPVGRVVHREGAYRLRLSPDGTRAATQERVSGGVRVVVVDQGGAVVTRSRMLVAVSGMVWSGDGAEVWFSGTDATAPSSVRALDMHGAERVVLQLPGGANVFDRAPDGRLLVAEVNWRAAVAYAEAGQRVRDLGWMDWSMPADMSADGRSVLFTEAREAGGPGGAVYLRRVDEPEPVRLGDGDALALTPDGRHVLAARRSTPPQLLLWPTGPGEPVPIATIDAQYQQVRFLPGGKRFAFVARSGTARQLYVQDVAGGAPRAVLAPYLSSSFAIAPDGSRIALVEKGRAWAHAIDGGAPEPLAGVPVDAAVVGWSADGGSLFVTRTQEGIATTLLRVDLQTRAAVELRRLETTESGGSQSIAPVLVSGDGTRVAYGVESSSSKLYVVSGGPWR